MSLKKFIRHIEADGNADLNEPQEYCQGCCNTFGDWEHINEIEVSE